MNSLDAIPACCLTVDANAGIIQANSRFGRLLGYPKDEILGSPLSKFLPLAGRIYLQTNLWPVLRHNGEVDEVYLRFKTVAGNELPMLVNALRREEGEGQLFNFVLISISERSEYEERLLEARRMAESAAQSKDEFLAVVTHELRGPLAAITGWTQMLQKGNLDAVDVTYALEAIERSAKLQIRLVEDLLDQSSMSSGRLRIHPEPTLIEEALQQAIDAARPVALTKNIFLEVEASEARDAWVLGDPERLRQVFWNLLTNAIKFTPQDGTVRAYCEVSQEGLSISVNDTGRGMAPEFLPTVFDPFRQEGRVPGAFSGVGLGMSITKNLVEMHNGTIQAHSEGLGRGATFTVTLPRVPCPTFS